MASDALGRKDHFDFTGGRSTVQRYRNCCIIERNVGDTRAVIHVSGRQYIDVAVAIPPLLLSLPTAPSLSQMCPAFSVPALLGLSAAFQVRSEQKKSRYHPIILALVTEPAPTGASICAPKLSPGSGHLFMPRSGQLLRGNYLCPGRGNYLCPSRGNYLCPGRGIFFYPRGIFLCPGRGNYLCPGRGIFFYPRGIFLCPGRGNYLCPGRGIVFYPRGIFLCPGRGNYLCPGRGIILTPGASFRASLYAPRGAPFKSVPKRLK